jgi:acyl-CoA synthetase (NDP forming)
MPTYAVARARKLADDAWAQQRSMLLEPEGFEILEALGIRTPARLLVRHSGEVPHTPLLLGERVVVKVVADAVAHKTDAGGVLVVRNRHDQIAAAVRQMESAFSDIVVSGYSIAECVPFDRALGHEWLLGMRWTHDFGPVVTVGVGGVAAEAVAAAMQRDRGSVVIAPSAPREAISERIRSLVLTPLVCGGVRRQAPDTTVSALAAAVEKLCALAEACRPGGITEFEVNPLVVSPDGLVALDVLAVLGDGASIDAPRRPLHKIRNLLQPRSIAIVGVSSRKNPGRIILENLLEEGFDRTSITIVKPGVTDVEGCAAVATLRDLTRPVDLAVLAVSATQVPAAIRDITDTGNAESVIVIPGGLEEKAGTDTVTAPVLEALWTSRASDWGGPVVNGGNCLGIQSSPGRYDTMFIPRHKLGSKNDAAAPLALITQSGAFAVSRATRLDHVRPRYTITVGNQVDLTIGDYLAYLEHDPEIQVFGIYVEGFKPLDGLAALESVRRITASGRTVVLYRAGRTREGAGATASHTAAVAGDYEVTRSLFDSAGAIVADTLDDFTELVMLFTMLQDRVPHGPRVGAMSNAGYECVALADAIGALTLPPFSDEGRARMAAILEARQLASLVDVHNPFDVTPMADDETFATVAETILADPHVDAAVVGCVPATSALNTLTASAAHDEDVAAPGGVAARLVRLARSQSKPMIAVIDAGHLYDAFAERLLAGGIPTFRSADRAMRLLGIWIEDRLTDRARREAERWVDEFSR